ncbi:MAG: hypothetical protein A4E48_00789 [Methanosaeta sp. PtaU1.Bin060]|nr:MAG: hypothetical protein A4E48_00789 [Methanosaeta sp. PtaU1.Bin060]
MPAVAGIEKRVSELEAAETAGAIPTTDCTGARTWIKGQGCGIRFMHDILELSKYSGEYPSIDEIPEALAAQVYLWSRAEVDGGKFGDLARSNRELARHILGLPHGGHF